jgi:uncharacterized membrane protein
MFVTIAPTGIPALDAAPPAVTSEIFAPTPVYEVSKDTPSSGLVEVCVGLVIISLIVR